MKYFEVNLKLQKIATETLRNGLVSYDKRKGWRGSLANKKYNINWHQDLKKFSRFHLKAKGGEGVINEFIEKLNFLSTNPKI